MWADITGPSRSCTKPATVMYDKQSVNVLIKDDRRVPVNEIVAQLVIGHSAVRDIRKLFSSGFPEHLSCICMMANCLQKWEICRRVMEHSSYRDIIVHVPLT